MQSASVEDRRLVISDPSLVSELNVTNKSLLSITAISGCTKLTTINLSFNDLTSITALSSLRGLVAVNVSHNKLKTIPALPATVTVFKATHNQITDVDGLKACAGLTELWLTNNQIANLGAVNSLVSSLSSLKSLVLLNNPCGRTDPPEMYRYALIHGTLAMNIVLEKKIDDDFLKFSAQKVLVCVACLLIAGTFGTLLHHSDASIMH
jgi:Leucine-rich repeat (LRR) protein